MELINKFIEACKANMPAGEALDSFVGFAQDAEDDPVKAEALALWCEEYEEGDGFRPEMYQMNGTELFDFFEDYRETNG